MNHLFLPKELFVNSNPAQIKELPESINVIKKKPSFAHSISVRIQSFKISHKEHIFTSSSTNLISKFLNFLTKSGKKNKAYSIFQKTILSLIKKKRKIDQQIEHSLNPLTSNEKNISSELYSIEAILRQSIQFVKPIFEVKKVRIAGTTHQVPSIVPFSRQENFAIRWMIQGAKEKKRKNPKIGFTEALAAEIYDASQKQGYARSKRDELHKIAEQNRASSHYRWW
jgi:small subunit ribosomal protein S7